MNFHNQLMAFAAILLSAQSFTSAAQSILTYKQMQLKVANAALIHESQVHKVINMRDIFLKTARFSEDCASLRRRGFTESGLYVIHPQPTKKTPPIVVNCDMAYDCGIGYTVLHRNSRGSELTWNETWTTYKFGFGNIQGDHYIGNEYMYYLTNQKWYKARIIIDGKSYAEYDIFRLDNEKTHYRLYLGAYRGNAGDALANYTNMVDNMPFSSRDMDADGDADNCASKYGGGWWFDTCSTTNPFAMLTQKENIHWEPFGKDANHVTLMVKPVKMYCRSEGY
ncbi:fibrinogen-like protein 1-like protein [Cetorhinus maximus]